MLAFAQWLQSTGFATELRGSAYAYPVILTLHLAAIGLFGSMILLVDLRLLGIAMRSRPAGEMIRQLRPLKQAGFLLLATCGLLLASTKAEEYYYNAFFRTKLALLGLVLVHAVVFRRSVYQNSDLDRAADTPAVAKLAAALSLLLWIGLVIAGRGIGYIEPPLDKIHAKDQKPGDGGDVPRFVTGKTVSMVV